MEERYPSKDYGESPHTEGLVGRYRSATKNSGNPYHAVERKDGEVVWAERVALRAGTLHVEFLCPEAKGARFQPLRLPIRTPIPRLF